MNRVALIITILTAGAFGQSLDLSGLDKLESKAKGVNTVSLDAGQIRGALNFLPQDESDKDLQQLRSIVGGIRSITVRNFEFAEKGQYSMADVDAVRAQVSKLPGWAKIVDSRDGEQHDEVYLLTQSEKIAGLAVIAAEPKELTVVFINGTVNLRDLSKLHGLAGIPNIEFGDKAPGGNKKK